jgi:hypothetical protein
LPKKRELTEKLNNKLNKRRETSTLKMLESGEMRWRRSSITLKKNLNSTISNLLSRNKCLRVPLMMSERNVKQMLTKSSLKSDGLTPESMMRRQLFQMPKTVSTMR